ncbi:MAG: DUF305 domain-containing protein [Xanthobacteraceae bacterium]|nr:DUF305 domain-containing protein [Xanthobacteraceae bacterium]
MHKHAYLRLAAMTALSFVAMYVLMYAMVDRFDNVFPNTNQIYMAGLMTAPMVIFELALMGAMYRNRAANIAIYAVSAVALIGFFAAIRAQLAIGDTQFLKSMIPHHAGAVLMCERAPISDPEIERLCATIVKGQNEEIAQMKALLEKR